MSIHLEAIRNQLQQYTKLDKDNPLFGVRKEVVYSYVIVKPNGEKHLHSILEMIRQQFTIEACFVIRDFCGVNLSLHPEENKRKFIVATNILYNDFYTNYAIAILLSKSNCRYNDIAFHVFQLKHQIRKEFEKDYISFNFDIARLGLLNEKQRLVLLDENGKQIEKSESNQEGTYLVIQPNHFHSPDDNAYDTVHELLELFELGVLCEENLIPPTSLKLIEEYGSFNFLKDI